MERSLWRMVIVAALLGLGALMPGVEGTALALSSNYNHELGVYSLKVRAL